MQVVEDLWASWLFRERWHGIFIPGPAIVNPKKTLYSWAIFKKHPSSGYRFPAFQSLYSILRHRVCICIKDMKFKRGWSDWNLHFQTCIPAELVFGAIWKQEQSTRWRIIGTRYFQICAESRVHYRAGTFLHNPQVDKMSSTSFPLGIGLRFIQLLFNLL